jgi:hypothetical protein
MAALLLILPLLAQGDKPEAPDPYEEYGPLDRGTWGTLSYIHVAHLDGKIFADENGVGGRLDFEEHFEVEVEFGFELNVHYEVDPEHGFMVINFTGIWLRGEEELAAATPFGGQIYPAGTKFRTHGHYLWYELGYGYPFRLMGDTLFIWAAFTFAADNFEIIQTQGTLPTDQYMWSYTVLAGGRVGGMFRPVPFIGIGIEAGGWKGGLTYEDEDRIDYDLSSWATLVNFWVSLDVGPGFSLRVGYFMRAAEVESNHTHPAGGGLPQRAENDDVFLRFGGLIFSLEFHY